MSEDRSKPPAGYGRMMAGNYPSWIGTCTEFVGSEVAVTDACWAHRGRVIADYLRESMCEHGEEGALHDRALCSECMGETDDRLREQQARGIEMARDYILSMGGEEEGLGELAQKVRRGDG